MMHVDSTPLYISTNRQNSLFKLIVSVKIPVRVASLIRGILYLKILATYDALIDKIDLLQREQY